MLKKEKKRLIKQNKNILKTVIEGHRRMHEDMVENKVLS
jgi:hypothetical protein